jgi:hypothetical protein
MRYKLDLVGVQGVSRDKGDNVRAEEYIFFCEKEVKINNWKHNFYTTE